MKHLDSMSYSFTFVSIGITRTMMKCTAKEYRFNSDGLMMSYWLYRETPYTTTEGFRMHKQNNGN